jgi:hypothetical protein
MLNEHNTSQPRAGEQKRTQQVEQLIHDHQKAIYAGIWSVLRGQSDLAEESLAAEVQCLSNDVWLWVIENLEDLLAPGTAKVGTRLRAKAFWVARSWKTQRLRSRKRCRANKRPLIGPDTDEPHLPITRRMLCVACQCLVSVASEGDGGVVILECGHARLRDISAKVAAAPENNLKKAA